jgi:D-galactarolactone cycloisomerase
MRLSRIELYLVSIPLTAHQGFVSARESFRPNWIPGFHQQDVKFYLLRLMTDDGIDGVAAVPAMGMERAGLGQLLGSYLLGMNPLDTRLINQRIEEFSYIGMRNGWIDAAFWDIIGKARGEPVWKTLGGAGGSAVPYASLGSNYEHDPKLVAERVRERRDFAGVKIRVKSMDLARMVEVVAAAREALGEDKQLMVDANLGWPVEILEPTPRWDEDFATRFAQAIEKYNVAWLEEPMHRTDFAGMARLRTRTKTPIAGGEINASWHDFRSMLDTGSLDIYQPDAVLAGGTFAGGMSVVYWLIGEIAKRNKARSAGDKPVRYTPHTWTTGLGFAVNLQLFALLPPQDRGLLELPHDHLWSMPQWASFIRDGFPRQADGTIKIPDTPGLGVEIDWSLIRRHGKRLFVATKRTMAISALSEHGYREAMYLRGKKLALSEAGQRVTFQLPPSPF